MTCHAKKIIGISLVLLSVVSLCACSNSTWKNNSNKKPKQEKVAKKESKTNKKQSKKQLLKTSTTFNYMTMPQAQILFSRNQTFTGIAVDPDTKVEYYVSGSGENGYSQSVAVRLDQNGNPVKYTKSIEKLALGE